MPRAAVLDVRVDKLYRCPSCGYRSCLLGIIAHALAKHRINLLAKSHKKAPEHRHRKSRYLTAIRYVKK